MAVLCERNHERLTGMTDPYKKKARKRTKKRKRRELERAVEENGRHAREKKRKGKR